MPFFAEAGFDCYAISLRGQGRSDCRRSDGEKIRVSGDMASLTADLAHVVAALPSPPVLVAHSFGGLLAESYCTQLGGSAPVPALAGVAVVCGVPPSGNKAIVGRVFKKSLVLAWKITWCAVSGPGSLHGNARQQRPLELSLAALTASRADAAGRLWGNRLHAALMSAASHFSQRICHVAT
jgi:pimeloyl-ACP methyl ester carboxylesterase